MKKREEALLPARTELLSFRNVPVSVAAVYLGVRQIDLKRALRDRRVTFGWASQAGETGQWEYHISPGGLVSYQERGARAFDLPLMRSLLEEAVEHLELKRNTKEEFQCSGVSTKEE